MQDLLVIRTAIPFGYLMIAVGLFCLAILAVALLLSGLLARPRRPKSAAFGTALLGFLGLIAWANMSEAQLDWNPGHGGNADLVGAWEEGAANLELLKDGHYRCQGSACAELGIEGLWQPSGDFYIAFHPRTGSEVDWRLVADGNSLRLAAGATESDPDMWSPRLTFRRIRPRR